MVGTKVLEEVASEKYFDQIDDLLDFQNDVVEEDGLWGCENFDFDSFPPVWLEESSALPSTGCNNHPSDFSADRHTAPYNDTLQLDWLSNIVQDSLSNSKTFPICHAKRARSKRPRPATFNPRSAIYLTPPSYFPVSHPLKKRPGQPKKKQKIQSYEQSNNQNEHPSAYPPRMCTHCKTTTTPQWRMGPDGPKTLCNACGVRYKSGRLFPEYRPAGSPTFVPSLHSNSHRKVIEIRNSKNENETVQPDLFEKSDQSFPKYSPAASAAFVPSLNSNSLRKAVELRKSKNENETIQPALFQKSDSIFPEYCPAASPTFIQSVNSNSPRKAVEMRKSKNENETIQPALFEKSDSLFPECSPATIPTFLPSLHSNSHQKVVETRKSKNEDITIQPDLFHKSSSYEKSLDISKCTSMVEVPVMIDLTYLPDLIPGSVIVIDSD